MCRLFAVRADRAVNAAPALVSAPHALVRQSCCDLRGECHPSGWGVGYYAGGRPVRVRSTLPAAEDPAAVEPGERDPARSQALAGQGVADDQSGNAEEHPDTDDADSGERGAGPARGRMSQDDEEDGDPAPPVDLRITARMTG